MIDLNFSRVTYVKDLYFIYMIILWWPMVKAQHIISLVFAWYLKSYGAIFVLFRFATIKHNEWTKKTNYSSINKTKVQTTFNNQLKISSNKFNLQSTYHQHQQWNDILQMHTKMTFDQQSTHTKSIGKRWKKKSNLIYVAH